MAFFFMHLFQIYFTLDIAVVGIARLVETTEVGETGTG